MIECQAKVVGLASPLSVLGSSKVYPIHHSYITSTGPKYRQHHRISRVKTLIVKRMCTSDIFLGLLAILFPPIAGRQPQTPFMNTTR